MQTYRKAGAENYGFESARAHPEHTSAPIIAKSTSSKFKKNFIKHLATLRSNTNMMIQVPIWINQWEEQLYFIASLSTERSPGEKHPLSFRQFPPIPWSLPLLGKYCFIYVFPVTPVDIYSKVSIPLPRTVWDLSQGPQRIRKSRTPTWAYWRDCNP